MRSYLNLGCGLRFHPAWTNVDFVAADPSVIAHDLRKGVPFKTPTYTVGEHFVWGATARMLFELLVLTHQA